MSSSSNTLTSGWYTNAYSGPFRSNRLRAPSLLPGSRRPIVIPVQQTLVVDVAHNHTNANGNHNNNNNSAEDSNKNVRRRETIFGPDVGEDDEPGWTENKGQEIGVDKVKQWVERSKNEEGLHATTTLQALVNLKRPTLLLQQIESTIEEDVVGRSSIDKTTEEDITVAAVSSPSAPSTPNRNSRYSHSKRDSTQIVTTPLHTLTFKYDATTPLCRIQLEIYPTPKSNITNTNENGERLSSENDNFDDGIEGKESIIESEQHVPKIIYSGLHQGGFNQSFTLPHTSALDLSSAIIPIEEQQAQQQREQQEQQDQANQNAVTNGLQDVSINNDSTANVTQTPAAEENNQSRWRRGLFRRNREEDEEANTAGIEMTNRLDANGQPLNPNSTSNANGGENQQEKKKEVEKGMRLLIRIDGVGPEGQALPRKNAQLTHILISGTWVADNNASTTDTTEPPIQGQVPGKRVWVVKVARREAIIGSHTFLLKEIYGLSSSSTSSTSNTQYPPAQDDPYASTPNECIVCLTSPRDVVLLPCRHLVVCRDCAVGMVEYGAGGKVGRREDGENTTATDTAAAATGTTGGASGSGTNNTATTTQVAGGTTTTGRERRKKKVKGWYCPVCRQPYTSLLRLALPESDKPSASHDEEETNELSRVPSRAASVRTTRTARSILAPSIAPTLPDGAERMLDNLRPDDVRARDNEEDEEDDEVYEHNHDHTHSYPQGEVERPQFVVANGNDDEDKKVEEIEHRENITTAPAPSSTQNQTRTHNTAGFDLGAPVIAHQGQTGNNIVEGRTSQEGKGWKEV
ncbi:uncharacterized protein L201_003678 [Kwoniella dendrophila CBS 6074]|uniref:RING-type domain-containing protein n=1 Tax=Kwoniella dendrophila CBS 6074 TaxID=1295534 RepID=A0AAX4JTL4_9TREE